MESPEEKNKRILTKIGHGSVLALALLGGSLLGGVTNKVSAKGLFLKLCWRFTGLLFILLVIMLGYQIYCYFRAK